MLFRSAGYTPYLNVAAFRKAQSTPNLLEIGDVSVTLPGIYAPSYSSWDASLLKKFSLGPESRYLQLRIEAQNLLNHMNCGVPVTDITSATFGRINTQPGAARVMMIAAKLYF